MGALNHLLVPSSPALVVALEPFSELPLITAQPPAIHTTLAISNHREIDVSFTANLPILSLNAECGRLHRDIAKDRIGIGIAAMEYSSHCR